MNVNTLTPQSQSQSQSQPDIDESHVLLRFKHGIHTIFLFVDVVATRADVSAQLLRVLRDRCPDGLRTSTEPGAPVTPIPGVDAEPSAPADDDNYDGRTLESRVEFAKPTNPRFPAHGGWTALDVRPDEMLLRKAELKNGGTLAFRFVSGRGKDRAAADDADGWTVQWAEPPVEDEREDGDDEDRVAGRARGKGRA